MGVLSRLFVPLCFPIGRDINLQAEPPAMTSLFYLDFIVLGPVFIVKVFCSLRQPLERDVVHLV